MFLSHFNRIKTALNRQKTTKHLYLIALCFLFLATSSGCDGNLQEDIPHIKSGTGFSAKAICTGVFASGIPTKDMKKYIAPVVKPLPSFWNVLVDPVQKSVTVRDIFFGLIYASTAVYREGLGCTITTGTNISKLRNQQPKVNPELHLPSNQPWPLGNAGIHPDLPNDIDYSAIEAAIDRAFTPDSDKPKYTAGIAVIYKGKLIAERYENQIEASSPILGYSMTKTVTGTLVGMLQERGYFNVQDPAAFSDWTGTRRADITIEHMLHMSSGLSYVENHRGDMAEMSIKNYDWAQFMIDKPLNDTPGTKFRYSTGESMLLAKVAQNAMGGSLQDAYYFIQNELLHKINITTSELEFDPSGTFSGGGGFALSARDWGRLGQLYLQDGVWNGEQILPAGWVDFARTPAPTEASYGVQMPLDGQENKGLPKDTHSFRGMGCQRVFMVPSKDLVVVRLGNDFIPGYCPVLDLVRDIVDAVDLQDSSQNMPHQLRPEDLLADSDELRRGNARLVMQGDGNLVIYRNGQASWSSNTHGNPGATARMQYDGNLVVYAANGQPLWSTRTHDHGGAQARLSADGNLVVHHKGATLWQTAPQDLFYQVSFKSFNNSYFVNEGNGGPGQTVNANSVAIGPWEKLILRKTGGGCIRNKNQVTIQSANSHYWSAQPNGRLNVDRMVPESSEVFTLINHTDGSGCLQNNHRISLHSAHNKYVVAEGDGKANVNRGGIGPWEKFVTVIH